MVDIVSRQLHAGVGPSGTTYLGLGVVFSLLGASDDGEPLVGIAQVRLIIANDAGRARVDQGLDTRLLARLDNSLGAVDVDLAEQLLVDEAVAGDGRGGVDDDVRAQLLEDARQLVGVGNVALVVGCVGAAVLLAAQVDRGDVGAPPRVNGLVDNVVAEEAVAANDQDLAEVAFLLLLRCHCDFGYRKSCRCDGCLKLRRSRWHWWFKGVLR